MNIVCLILSFVIVVMMYADDWHETSMKYKLAEKKLKIEQDRINNLDNQRW